MAQRKFSLEFSAGGIVVKNDKREGRKFLLIKDSYGHWTWPKGKIDKGESVTDAALREIREETGLSEVAIAKQIGKSQYYYQWKGTLIFKTVYLFVCKLLKDQPLTIQTEEIQAGRWFSPEVAIEHVDYKGAKEMVKEALRVAKQLRI
jgi:8-oxo-dGTP pyrophosphatase MutT (NUDIX family)